MRPAAALARPALLAAAAAALLSAHGCFSPTDSTGRIPHEEIEVVSSGLNNVVFVYEPIPGGPRFPHLCRLELYGDGLAVFRTGRFDEKVYIGPPDLPAREKILELNLKGAHVAEGLDFHAIAEGMEGASGSDVAAVVSAAKRAALGRAIRDDADPVLTADDFAEARKRIPLSITDEILAPYKKFMEERF